MCISTNSYLCVCDTHNYRILIFDTCLNYLRALNIQGQAINVEEFAGKLYVSIEIPHGCIEVLTINGMPLHTIRHQALRIPVTARVRNNLLYVADYGNSCVVIFTLDGDHVGSFGHDQLHHPEGMDIDDDGYFYVSNAGKNIIVF